MLLQLTHLLNNYDVLLGLRKPNPSVALVSAISWTEGNWKDLEKVSEFLMFPFLPKQLEKLEFLYSQLALRTRVLPQHTEILFSTFSRILSSGQGMVACACNPSIWEAKTRKSWTQDKPQAWATWWDYLKMTLASQWVIQLPFWKESWPITQKECSTDHEDSRQASPWAYCITSLPNHTLHSYPRVIQLTETWQFFLGLWVFIVRTLCHIKLWLDRSVIKNLSC